MLLNTQLTDEVATIEATVNTSRFTNLIVDIITDKACSVVITPVPEEGVAWAASDTGTASVGSSRFIYSNIGSPKATVAVTKTDAGNSTTFACYIHGN